MDNLCRFCLNLSKKGMYKLQQNDILRKIETFLTIYISAETSFPNQLCQKCLDQLEEISQFCSKIKENQEKLQKHLTNGSLKNFYLKLTNNIEIKEEQNDFIVFCESKFVKVESTDKITDIEIINKNDESEQFKNEESADDGCRDCSTDDELTLSAIKTEKELNTETEKKTIKLKKDRPQRIKNKPLKSIDITQSADNIKKFTCLSCLKPHKSQTELIKHYHEEHLSKNNIKNNFTINKTDGSVIYKCDTCEKTCNLKKDIVKHVTVHNNERPLICKLCGRMYKLVSDIIRHARVHNGFKLQCSFQCGYSTAYRGALKEHENRHLDVYKYTCDKCGKGFHVKTWYEQHQNIHTGVKPFVCDICGLAFHMARYLTAHRSSIHPQSSSVKRYICVHCNQKCDSACSLSLHLEKHGIRKEKEFLCDFCGKILSSADQLKCHHRMHSGVKPYSCSICNKSFANKFNVKVHMTSHSGEKTHSCTRCGKRYTQRSTLLRHLRRHHSGSTSPKRPGCHE